MTESINTNGYQRATMSVADAGRVLGIGRGAAYEAARRGDFPTRRIGKRILVPIKAFESWLSEREAA